MCRDTLNPEPAFSDFILECCGTVSGVGYSQLSAFGCSWIPGPLSLRFMKRIFPKALAQISSPVDLVMGSYLGRALRQFIFSLIGLRILVTNIFQRP